MKKHIYITCNTVNHIELDELLEFQGNLKTLDKIEAEKLKQSILKHGFSFPFFVWTDNQKQKHIIDGHQRLSVLKDMCSDGYEVNSLPVVYIEAKTEKQA